MKKTNVLWIIINTICLIIFNALFYLIGGTEHILSVWLSYVFTHLAYLLLLVTPILVRGGKSGTTFGFSIHSVSVGYFLLQLATGAVMILLINHLPIESITVPLLVQLCIAGLYGILLLVSMITGERKSDAGGRGQQATSIKDLAIRLKSVQDKVKDKAAKKKVKKLYDALSSCTEKTHPQLEQIDRYIIQTVGELEKTAYEKNYDAVVLKTDSIMSALNERAARLKKLK